MDGPRGLLTGRTYLALPLLAPALLMLALTVRHGCAGEPGKTVILMRHPVKIVAISGESEPPDVHELLIRVESGTEHFLTSNAGAPGFPLTLRVRGDRLQVDLDRTWRENQGRFRENEALIHSLSRKRRPLSGPDHNDLAESFLFNSVLAKYCQRNAELEKLMQLAPSALDRDDYRLFKALVSEVIPGELPRPEVRVITERP